MERMFRGGSSVTPSYHAKTQVRERSDEKFEKEGKYENLRDSIPVPTRESGEYWSLSC